MREKGRSRRRFTAEFQAEAVKLMNERLAQGVTLAQIARDLDLNPDHLRTWAKILGAWPYDKDHSNVVPASSSPAELEKEVRRLRNEVEMLRQERDFLKKAAAFFAKESQ
jgi:transposase